MSRREYHCAVCIQKRQEPVYCAPKRCMCGHAECPAYSSYIELGATT